MLLRFRVSNHASIRDEQELSLVAEDDRPRRAQRLIAGTDLKVVPVAAIYGANASGKSNFVDAMKWMRHAVLSSFAAWDPQGGVPRRPFAFSSDPAGEASTYGVDLVVDGVRYEYGFTVDDREVRAEWLASYPEGRRRKLFERTGPGKDTLSFGRFLLGRRKAIADLTRANSLYLSVGAAHDHPLLRSIHAWFQHGLRTASDHDYNSRLTYTIDVMRSAEKAEERGKQGAANGLTRLLRFADLGVDRLTFGDPDPRIEEEHQRLVDAVAKAMGEQVRVEGPPPYEVRVQHRTGDGIFPLALERESSGTKTWIGMLGPVLTTLVDGGVLVVDELDARLHPQLSDALVGMFQRPEINTRGAQLVFTTHEASLLGNNVRTELVRDQVWFTEKDRVTLATRVYPVTDFYVRDGEGPRDNLEKRYLTGRYGSLPLLDDSLLEGFAEMAAGGGTSGPGETAGAQEAEEAGAAQSSHLLRR
ncbi:ATP/GTP-binding protein [Streptomyces sp. NPDC088923]|uniref:AAA family ATPase n=1 Tax=Streptomyces sp. NPDC088923 TaxID=3365913 RepID=UPI0038059FF9